MEPVHNRTRRAVAAQKARGSPVARPHTKTLILLVGDTGDRLLLDDWCRRFRMPLKPWVGFTPKSGRCGHTYSRRGLGEGLWRPPPLTR
jgi:hypothetical protein